MSLIKMLTYVGKRFLIVIPALLIASALMGFLRYLEYKEIVSTGTSKLGSVLYFHIASFGVLWLFLRAPYHWARAILVMIWIAYDAVLWTISGSFTGKEFEWSYTPSLWHETLIHRYMFFASAALSLTIVNQVLKRRIVRHQSQAKNITLSDANHRWTITHLFFVISLVALGCWLLMLEKNRINANVPGLAVSMFDVIDISRDQINSSVWSVIRGVVLWLIALFLIGSGRFNIWLAFLVAGMLPLVNIALFKLQELAQMPDDSWEFYTPIAYATYSESTPPYMHALIASMLTFFSVLVLRVFGYEYRRVAFESAGDMNEKSFSEIDG